MSLKRLLCTAMICGAVPAAPATAQSVPDTLLRETFLAFFPLYEIGRLRYVAVEQASNPVRRDANTIQHSRRLLDHRARVVTAPNNDTLYSSIHLDLSRGPVLIETPAIAQRYYSLHFMNAYTDNIAIIGRRAEGDGPLRVAVHGPGFAGELPAHTQRVQADTNDVWLLVRIVVDGPADVATVGAIQNGIRLTAPVAGPGQAVMPVKDPNPEQFLAVVNEMLARNPPQGMMAGFAERARALGVAAGEVNAWNQLDEATRTRWSSHWSALVAGLRGTRRAEIRMVGGLEYPPPGVGQWGSNIGLRASVALQGIGALDAVEVLYLGAERDLAGTELNGSQRYRMRIPAEGIPVRGFWSLTLYELMPDGRRFLVENPVGRYSVGDRTQGLVRNADGSIDILMQRDAPADPRNWLPTPAGDFRLSLRAYLPSQALTEGKVALPVIERLTP